MTRSGRKNASCRNKSRFIAAMHECTSHSTGIDTLPMQNVSSSSSSTNTAMGCHSMQPDTADKRSNVRYNFVIAPYVYVHCVVKSLKWACRRAVALCSPTRLHALMTLWHFFGNRATLKRSHFRLITDLNRIWMKFESFLKIFRGVRQILTPPPLHSTNITDSVFIPPNPGVLLSSPRSLISMRIGHSFMRQAQECVASPRLDRSSWARAALRMLAAFSAATLKTPQFIERGDCIY
jgi:hypothetical protein